MAEIKQDGGGELTIAAMDKYSRENIGRKTYQFMWRLKQNPQYWQMVQDKLAQMRAAGDPLLTPGDQDGSVTEVLAGT